MLRTVIIGTFVFTALTNSLLKRVFQATGTNRRMLLSLMRSCRGYLQGLFLYPKLK
jgi:hypothetical protein